MGRSAGLKRRSGVGVHAGVLWCKVEGSMGWFGGVKGGSWGWGFGLMREVRVGFGMLLRECRIVGVGWLRVGLAVDGSCAGGD